MMLLAIRLFAVLNTQYLPFKQVAIGSPIQFVEIRHNLPTPTQGNNNDCLFRR